MGQGMEIICQALKVRAALREMHRAKVNEERERAGLPPIRSWYENCFANCKVGMRKVFIESCCTCCHYSRNRHIIKNRFAIFQDGTYPNCVLKSFIGFAVGLLVSYLWYFVMIYQLMYKPDTSAGTCIILGTVLSIGLAFSNTCRCLTMLMLPTLCSKQGRSAILAYIFVLVVTHPMGNFKANVHVLSDSTTCGQEVGYNATREMVDMAMAPVNAIVNEVRDLIATLVALSEKLRAAFLAVRDLFSEILDAIDSTFEWLGNMVNVCNDRMGAPYDKCIAAFDRAIADCKSKLGIVSFLCEIPAAFRGICNVARLGELLCHITRKIVGYIKHEVRGGLTVALQDVYDMFYFNVTLVHHYNLTLEQSQTFAEVRDNIRKEVDQRLGPLEALVSFSHIILIVTFTWMLVKALMYRHKYLTKDRFDNFYISWPLRDIDAKLKDRNKETVLPLNWKEQRRYVYTGSIRMTKPERRKLIIGLIMLTVTTLHAGFYLACDFGLYWLLNMLKRHMYMEANQDIPAHVRMHVQGDGILPDIYRTLITKFDPVAKGAESEMSLCLPHPSPPNFNMYKNIAALFSLSLILVLCEAYGLRLRHVVCSIYYPGREEARAAYLTHQILQRRGGYLKHLRRKMRGNAYTAHEAERTSMRSKLAAKSQLCEYLFRLCGYHRKFCLGCAAPGRTEDMDNFVHCDNKDCKAVYCQDCFTDINNLCTVCMNPVDYGDLSDISEERDSSDDEPDVEEITKERKEALLGQMLLDFSSGHFKKSPAAKK